MTFVRNDVGGLIPPFGGEAFPWIGGDAQTVRHFIRRDAPPPPPSRRIEIDLDDGDRLLAAFHPALPNAGTRRRGCIIAVHGLLGCMDAQHIWWLTPQVLAAGYSLLRVNMRGAGAARQMARKTYNAAAGADLLPFIDAAAKNDPGVPIFMVAHSLGGTTALNMALDFPDTARRLAGLVTIGTPLDMAATAAAFNARRNWPYIRHMLDGLRKMAACVPGLDVSYLAAAKTSRTLYEFDDYVTAPLGGFADSGTYYRAASVHHRLEDVPIPVLVLHGSNDPWVPAGPALDQPLIDKNGASNSPGAQIVVTKGGGHVGFHDQALNWHIRATLAWCAGLVE